MCHHSDRRLCDADEVSHLLHLTADQLGSLVRTGQLVHVHICGQVLFDFHDLDDLVETYKRVSARKISHG